jgi:hypothetical protein
MGPITFHPDIWPPVERPDAPPRGDLVFDAERDRRERLAQRRRRKGQEQNPDADEFQHRPEESEES